MHENLTISKKDFDLFIGVTRLEVKMGHLKWKVTDLCGISGVSRSYIYRTYNGKRETILLEAIKCIGTYICGIDDRSITFWKQGRLTEILLEKRTLVQSHPEIFTFYIKTRNYSNIYSKTILELENAVLEKSKNFSVLTDEKLIKCSILLHFGIIFQPFIEIGLSGDNDLQSVLKKLIS